jgi:hypothetical protein
LYYNLEFDPEISIGTPWWNYWFSIAYHLGGGPLFMAPAPMLLHLDHKQGWSYESWLAHGRRMHDAIARDKDQDGLLPFIKYGETEGLSDQEVGELATATFQWLKTVPWAMNVDDPSAWLWCSLLAGIEAVPREAREAEQRLREIEHGFKEAEQRLKNSLSWKLTKPIRSIEEKLVGSITQLMCTAARISLDGSSSASTRPASSRSISPVDLSSVRHKGTSSNSGLSDPAGAGAREGGIMACRL